jgi:hypothetical protein
VGIGINPLNLMRNAVDLRHILRKEGRTR